MHKMLVSQKFNFVWLFNVKKNLAERFLYIIAAYKKIQKIISTKYSKLFS